MKLSIKLHSMLPTLSSVEGAMTIVVDFGNNQDSS